MRREGVEDDERRNVNAMGDYGRGKETMNALTGTPETNREGQGDDERRSVKRQGRVRKGKEEASCNSKRGSRKYFEERNLRK